MRGNPVALTAGEMREILEAGLYLKGARLCAAVSAAAVHPRPEAQRNNPHRLEMDSLRRAFATAALLSGSARKKIPKGFRLRAQGLRVCELPWVNVRNQFQPQGGLRPGVPTTLPVSE